MRRTLKIERVFRLAELRDEGRLGVTEVGPVDPSEPWVGLHLVRALGSQSVRGLSHEELCAPNPAFFFESQLPSNNINQYTPLL